MSRTIKGSKGPLGLKKIEAKPQAQVPKRYKTVAPPKDPERRRLMEGEDITTSGGCRSQRRTT